MFYKKYIYKNAAVSVDCFFFLFFFFFFLFFLFFLAFFLVNQASINHRIPTSTSLRFVKNGNIYGI